MRFRQIHLDFHTSEHIEHVGAAFKKEEFQAALKQSHADSITLFAKCHHGWSYHPTKVGHMHPQLDFDLLQMQIEAAHEIGIRTEVYLSAGIDEQLARRRPDWLVRNRDESTTWAENFSVPGYHIFCMNSPYLDYLAEQVREVVENYDADAIFLDIAAVYPCCCQTCVAKRRAKGLDPYDEKAIREMAEETYFHYTEVIRKAVDTVHPGLPVYHNGGVVKGRREFVDVQSHFEIESLPTGGWGYDHFPLAARYVQGLGKEFLGMTGKFHSLWGEFGGFKHPNALRYEVCLSVANGAKCSIGDQLHPSGKMDPATYEIIGAAYEALEPKEAWLDGVSPVADIGVLTAEVIKYDFDAAQVSGCSQVDTGVVRILLEGNYLFDVIDLESDFSKYKVIILPDIILISDKLQKKLNVFLENGGRIFASGKSGLDPTQKEFLLDFGLLYQGENVYCPSYLAPCFETEYIRKTAYVCYSQGETVTEDGGEVLAWTKNPYFNRTTEHFCSHQHAPDSEEVGGVGMAEGKDGIYMAWQVFSDYALRGNIIYKQAVCYALDRLLGNEKTVRTNLPAQGVVTLMDQKDDHRLVCHLLYASPVARGENINVIEDINPIYDLILSLKCDKVIKQVYLAPQMEKLDFSLENHRVTLNGIRLDCHQMIVFDYEN